MLGETVTVHTWEANGADGYNAPTFVETTEVVENVLVAPVGQTDLDATRPEGVQVAYSLCFPKTYGKALEGADVEVRGHRCRVIGHADVFDPALCPTDWNMAVEVVEIHG